MILSTRLKIYAIIFTRYTHKIYTLYIYNTYEYRFKKKKKRIFKNLLINQYELY